MMKMRQSKPIGAVITLYDILKPEVVFWMANSRTSNGMLKWIIDIRTSGYDHARIEAALVLARRILREERPLLLR